MTDAAYSPSLSHDGRRAGEGQLLDGGRVYDAGVTAPVEVSAARTRSAWRLLARALEPASLAPTYLGAIVVAAGFALIGLAWSEVAGLTAVGLQMPYLVSAGFTGLGLVMTGLVVINVAAKRQDGAERARQMQTLAETFQSLRQEIARLDQPRSDP